MIWDPEFVSYGGISTRLFLLKLPILLCFLVSPLAVGADGYSSPAEVIKAVRGVVSGFNGDALRQLDPGFRGSDTFPGPSQKWVPIFRDVLLANQQRIGDSPRSMEAADSLSTYGGEDVILDFPAADHAGNWLVMSPSHQIYGRQMGLAEALSRRPPQDDSRFAYQVEGAENIREFLSSVRSGLENPKQDAREYLVPREIHSRERARQIENLSFALVIGTFGSCLLSVFSLGFVQDIHLFSQIHLTKEMLEWTIGAHMATSILFLLTSNPGGYVSPPRAIAKRILRRRQGQGKGDTRAQPQLRVRRV